ncbi:MAG: nitrate reductase molybdenum cofactor assembly chaperone [Alphaproteobacteria bacterium]|nr:nitrate reductase molybdenum cofactor assembly chaperone [Alphaproteobacteria bacterium]MDE2014284.1 nitrate reductase molybdenum cofactor assembly chaperone [Alphaproteobacteria bacterium]MDE2352951.1 nitrate reductase molybdenum cofactor assembly chaperone [Alphaproteobacteria bacterium]
MIGPIRDRTLKALSLLLSYPSHELQAAMAEIGGVLAAESRLTAQARRELRQLVEGLRDDDIYALQERYVALFDRSRALSLNLFEHVHGESRDRGGAMVSLLETYRAGGFEPASWELPDHLPVLLEFLSTRPEQEARDTLADAAHIFDALAARLGRRTSPYAAVLAALLQLAGGASDREAVAELLAAREDDPDDLAALDATWEETEVSFGPDPSAGCPVSRELLARMNDIVPSAPGRAAD